jgi:hypothetical protein
MNRLLVATPYGPSAPVVAVLVAPPELLHKASRVRVVPIGDRTIDNGCCLLVAGREVARDVVPLVRAGASRALNRPGTWPSRFRQGLLGRYLARPSCSFHYCQRRGLPPSGSCSFSTDRSNSACADEIEE